MYGWYDKDDKYIDIVNDMCEDNVLDDDDIEDLDLSKEKVVSTLTKAYQFDIKYIDEALENIVGIEQQISIESEKKL